MGKFTELETDIYSIFGSGLWQNENIKTVPANFIVPDPGTEYIRINVVPSGTGINRNSVSGILLIDIFTSAGEGTRASTLIADKLDDFLQEETISTVAGKNTQFKFSTLTFDGLDPVSKNLHKSSYTIPFNYFGVL